MEKRNDYKERLKLVEEALKHKRSTSEIKENFKAAGIIDDQGNLKKPYQKVNFDKMR